MHASHEMRKTFNGAWKSVKQAMDLRLLFHFSFILKKKKKRAKQTFEP